MLELRAFSAKEVRTAIRILRLVVNSGHTIDELLEHTIDIPEITKSFILKEEKVKTTPEEKAFRKRMLAKGKYGRTKAQP